RTMTREAVQQLEPGLGITTRTTGLLAQPLGRDTIPALLTTLQRHRPPPDHASHRCDSPLDPSQQLHQHTRLTTGSPTSEHLLSHRIDQPGQRHHPISQADSRSTTTRSSYVSTMAQLGRSTDGERVGPPGLVISV